MLEFTVISAQGLKNTSSFFLFSHPLKPFITITTFPLPPPPPPPSSLSLWLSLSSSCNSIKGCNYQVYTTMVDDQGGPNPTWGDKFLLPLDPTLFTTARRNYSCVYLQLFTKRALLGPYLLGWIQIPASDIFDDGPFPLGLVRHLSYRVLKKDGSRGYGIVNVACRFVGQLPAIRQPQRSGNINFAGVDTWLTVTGIPVNGLPMKVKCT